VANSDCTIPVRADLDCEPSDLIRSRRPRLIGTPSVKWICPERLIEIQRPGKIREM
jgi:hypothetical protein